MTVTDRPNPVLASEGREPPHCHVPATFEPAARARLVSEIKRLIGAARWLEREISSERGCIAALTQVASLQADLDVIANDLVDAHLRYCVDRAVRTQQSSAEVQALLTPLRSVMFARR